jgi:outer membrane receptor protein involved in Fe transport
MASRDRLTLHDGPATTAHASYDDRYAWLNLRRSWSDALFTQSVLTWGSMGRDRKGAFDNEFDLQRGQLEDHHQSAFVTLKNDATLHLSPRQMLKLGATAKRVRAQFDVEGSSVIPFAIFALGSPPREIRRSIHVRPGGSELEAYVADRVRITDSLVAEAGLRAGRESYTPDGVHVSPRLNFAWTLSPRTSVRAAWGWFHQPQAIHELQVEDGVTEYQPAQRAEHRVLGVEQSFRGGIQARLELYDKTLTHLRPRYTNLYDRLLLFPELRADRVLIAPEKGHARGAELLVRSDAAQPLSAWLSYTFARVTDRVDSRDVPRDWDQPHAMTFSVNYQRGAHWNFNLTGTWHSGWPTTPVLARVEGTQLVTELGPRNSTRLPDYQRFDFRASHTAGAFSVFVEVFNLLNHENVTRVNTFQFQQNANGAVTASPVTESVIGIVPSFGVTWRF